MKPKPVTKWYRVALFRSYGDVYFTFITDSDCIEDKYFKHPDFIRWITDRQYVEVE